MSVGIKKGILYIAVLILPFIQKTGYGQDLQPLFDQLNVHAGAHGIWQNMSYGWTLDISESQVEMYHYSKAGCIKDPAGTEDIAGLVQFFVIDAGQLKLSIRTEGSTVYTFDEIERVPDACAEEITNTPQAVFDYFWHLMDAHYAFFDVYGVDWNARREAFADDISAEMTDAALFEVLSNMMEGLNDGHLGLNGEIDGEEEGFSASKPRVLEPALSAAFKAQSDIEERSDFFTQWFFGSLNRFRDQVLDQRGQGKAAGGNINWGRINNIGYISVFGMGGFASNEDETLEDEIAGVHMAMNEALSALEDTDGLIFDIALNQGGMDEVSLALASHFTAERVKAYSKVAHNAKVDPQPLYVEPAPSNVQYLKPVTLFTSDLTVSAAEIFTMAMRSLPNVTHRGDVTWGALSDILSKPLPNGWMLELSNEIYQDAAGKKWEGRGITPEEMMTVFDPENITQSHHNAILAVVSRMQAAVK